MVREAWTDERLDDLKEHMDEGFRELRTELRQQREATAAEFATVRKDFAELRNDFAEVKSQVAKTDARIDELVRTVQIGFWLIATFLVGLMGMFATQL